MIDASSLAHAKTHRLQLTGNLLSDLEARESMEDGVLERLKFGLSRTSALNQSVLASLKELNGETAWGINTQYTLETLRAEAEQMHITKQLQTLYSSSADGGMSAAVSKPGSSIHVKRDDTHDEYNVSKIAVPEMGPFTDLLQQLMHERVADELQPRLRNTIDRTFVRPLFPDAESSEKLTSLPRLMLTVSGVILVASQADGSAGGPGAGSAIGGLARGNNGGPRRTTVFGQRHTSQQCRRKHQRLEEEIRELVNPTAQTTAAVSAGAPGTGGGEGTMRYSIISSFSAGATVGAAPSAASAMSPTQLAMKVESLLDEDIDTCEKWFDQAARAASEFVCDSASPAASGAALRNGASSDRKQSAPLTSAFLLQTKEEIATMLQVLYETRDAKMEFLHKIRQDEMRLEEYFDAQNEEDLKQRVAFNTGADDNVTRLAANFAKQREQWEKLVAALAALQGLSAEANTLVKRHVNQSEAELERRQQFAEMQHAKDTQTKIAERLRFNMKAALKFLETTAEFLGYGQAQITTAKVGAELSSGLRDAAASLHEAYFEFATRLCRRISQYERRIESSELVHRAVDKGLAGLKATKVIQDEAGSAARHLKSVRDSLQERLDAATEKLERHLMLHRSIRDAESSNHSQERPVTQRVRELEVTLREDVINALATHFSSENVFLDVARNRLDVATRMSSSSSSAPRERDE